MNKKDINENKEAIVEEIKDEENHPEKNKEIKIESKKSFFEKIEDVLMFLVKSIYKGFLFVIKFLLMFLGFIFYPIKERFFNLAKNIDLYMNPYKNPNYHEI